MPEATVTLQALWESAGAVLAAAGIEAPRREAIRIWSDLERVETARAMLGAAEPVAAERAERFIAAVGRRAAGEPLAYVTGWTGFRRLTLAIDRRALIPRPETEGLVELALGRCRTGVAADVCTGSGAIALALADEGDFSRILATDVSADALALARENGTRTGVGVDWRAGDLLGPLAGETLDLLVANPPYLTEAEYASLDDAVRAWEPRLALPSGTDGLDATRRLLDEGRALMADSGHIALEVDCHRAGEVRDLAGAFGWRDPAVLEDLFGRARYVVARWER